MHQIIMILSGFSTAQKKCKTFFSDKILYKWYKYIISLQNYPIKMTIKLLINL